MYETEYSEGSVKLLIGLMEAYPSNITILMESVWTITNSPRQRCVWIKNFVDRENQMDDYLVRIRLEPVRNRLYFWLVSTQRLNIFLWVWWMNLWWSFSFQTESLIGFQRGSLIKDHLHIQLKNLVNELSLKFRRFGRVSDRAIIWL